MVLGSCQSVWGRFQMLLGRRHMVSGRCLIFSEKSKMISGRCHMVLVRCQMVLGWCQMVSVRSCQMVSGKCQVVSRRQTQTKCFITDPYVSSITKTLKYLEKRLMLQRNVVKCCEKVLNKCSPDWALADFKLTMNADV